MSNNDWTPNFSNSLSTKTSEDISKIESADPPVSFEALLMKGEERANLLQKIGLDKKDPEKIPESYRVETSSMSEDKPQSARGKQRLRLVW